MLFNKLNIPPFQEWKKRPEKKFGPKKDKDIKNKVSMSIAK